jgi:hypothetical protein
MQIGVLEMEDPILKAYLRDFSDTFDLKEVQESVAFEFFAAYCVFFRDFSEHVVLDDLIVAGGLDTAIDSIGIFINDIPVTSQAQVDEIVSRHKIDVDFCFIQAKTSRNLNAAEIGSFIQGVKEFFGTRFMPEN